MQAVFIIAVLVVALAYCSPGEQSPVQAQTAAAEQRARIACRARIIQVARLPEAVNASHVQATRNAAAGHWLVAARGTMKNALGLDAPFEAYCHVSDDFAVTKFAIE